MSFSEGDIIEIVAETNADWWTGSFNGRQGLFPSNHVEKLASTPIRSPAPAPAAPAVGARPYRPFGAVYHGADAPPPANAGAVNSVGLQEAPGQEQKKKKFGKLGNTVCVLWRLWFECELNDSVDGELCCRWCWIWCRYAYPTTSAGHRSD